MTVSHFVRRGVEAISTVKNGEMPDVKLELGSPWLVGLLCITVLGFVYTIFSVEYTFGLLVPTLAAVESSNPELYLRVENEPENNRKPGDSPDLEIEIATAPAGPITSKLRTTIRHLRSRGGRCARFRGLSMLLTYLLAERFVNSLVPLSYNAIFLRFVVKMATAILLANLQVAWVHIVISEPSPKRFYKRIPSFRNLRKIVPAAAFEHLLTNGAYYAVIFVIKHVHGLDEINLVRNFESTSPAVYRTALNMFSIATFVSWLASIPARVIFVRVAASMLPDEDEAIVPFDRSFGGKVVPDIVGGGVLTISDAWKTFDRDGLKRYIRAICKATAIQCGVTMIFSVVIMAEILGGAVVCKFGDQN